MKKNIYLFAFVIVSISAVPLRLTSSEVNGHIRIVGPAGRATVATVVYAESVDGPSPTRPGHYQLTQKNKSFAPHILAIPAGSTVDFPNLDSIFHNAFSLTRPGPFDMGLYRAGASKAQVFRYPATYHVFCNIHPQMSAVILVLPTSLITEADDSGNYRFNLPPGHYRVTAWSDGSNPVSTLVTVSTAPVTVPEMSMEVHTVQTPPHKNKYGQDYPAAAYDPLKGN